MYGLPFRTWSMEEETGYMNEMGALGGPHPLIPFAHEVTYGAAIAPPQTMERS